MVAGRYRKACLALAVLIAFGASPAVCAAAAATMMGQWVNVQVNVGPLSTPKCRYVIIETRTYTLNPGDNGAVIGNYMRNISAVWVGALPGCSITSASAYGLPDARIDAWVVSGDMVDADTVRLSGMATGKCLGPCETEVKTSPTFTTTLKRREGGLYDLGDGSPEQLMLLVRKQEKDDDEASANAALRPLLQPLMDGDCNAFYAHSLDAGTRRRFKPDAACRILQPMGALFADAIYDTRSHSYRVSLGLVRPEAPLILIDGDVMVERVFVVQADGSTILVRAILRKQTDGRWAIVDFAP